MEGFELENSMFKIKHLGSFGSTLHGVTFQTFTSH